MTSTVSLRQAVTRREYSKVLIDLHESELTRWESRKERYEAYLKSKNLDSGSEDAMKEWQPG